MFDIWSIIAGILPVSSIDYPKKLATVLYTQGSNFRCPTCHNKDLIPKDADESAPSISGHKLIEALKQRINIIDSVVITGGEPTIHGMDLINVIRSLKSIGLQIKLDTNGTHPEVVRDLLIEGIVDLVAVDIKGPFALYPELTGGDISAEDAESNFNAFKKLADKYEGKVIFRTTLVPKLADSSMCHNCPSSEYDALNFDEAKASIMEIVGEDLTWTTQQYRMPK
jgi:pyruvate formate lyase activating enzyme